MLFCWVGNERNWGILLLMSFSLQEVEERGGGRVEESLEKAEQGEKGQQGDQAQPEQQHSHQKGWRGVGVVGQFGMLLDWALTAAERRESQKRQNKNIISILKLKIL